MGLERRETATRSALAALRDHFSTSVASHERARQELEPTIRTQQQALVRQGITAVRRELHSMAMEGDAGALEAIWRFKEDHRDQIKALELERRVSLDELELKYGDVLATLEDEAVEE
jgi:hypothetical protein